MSQSSSEWRNDETMIAIETIRLTLATIVARLTATWPGAERSCASASCAGTARGLGAAASAATASRGISSSVPMSSSAMAA